MATEIEKLLSFVFRQAGRDVLLPSRIYGIISFDMHWYEPMTARKIVKRSLELGYLREEQDGLAPAFDYRSVELPFGFAPSIGLLEEMSENEKADVAAAGPSREANLEIPPTSKQGVLSESAETTEPSKDTMTADSVSGPAEGGGLFDEMLRHYAKELNLDRHDLAAESNSLQDSMEITPQAALLLVAYERGADATIFLDKVKQSLTAKEA